MESTTSYLDSLVCLVVMDAQQSPLSCYADWPWRGYTDHCMVWIGRRRHCIWGRVVWFCSSFDASDVKGRDPCQSTFPVRTRHHNLPTTIQMDLCDSQIWDLHKFAGQWNNPIDKTCAEKSKHSCSWLLFKTALQFHYKLKFSLIHPKVAIIFNPSRQSRVVDECKLIQNLRLLSLTVIKITHKRVCAVLGPECMVGH